MVLRVLLAIVAFIVILKLGTVVLRALAQPRPPPPPPGELRRVNLRYRCVVCGAEVKMVSAPDEMPPPPKHCVEDMELVAPLFE